MPTLFILSGLPGTGKTTLARRLAQLKRATHLRIDTIEQSLRDFGLTVEGEGYCLAYRMAADNLRLGLDVVADSCNPIELTRREWEEVANENHARYVNIEVTCSDPEVHRSRVETRVSDISGLVLPKWNAVEKREYDAWSSERIVVDTANRAIDDCMKFLEDSIFVVAPSDRAS